MNHKVNQQGQSHVVTEEGIEVMKHRTDVVISLKAGHRNFVHDWRGGLFEPRKVTVTFWPEEGRMKARVQCSGPSATPGVRSTGTCTFNLSGYDNYNPCPEWIAKLARRFGYQYPIERIV